MFYYLSYLTDWLSPLRVFRYITFRAFAGAATAFLISVLIGPWMIRKLNPFAGERSVATGQSNATMNRGK